MRPEEWDPHDVEIADNMRAFAQLRLNEATAAIDAAVKFEKDHGIWPPCHLCGRRNCGH